MIFSIDGVVSDGKHLGRRLGFPTANVSPVQFEGAWPKNGVYVAAIWLEGEGARLCMLNQGVHPTAPEGPPTVEAHILDYDGDAYGQRARVAYLHFMRPERRFESLEALTAQLSRDRAATEAWLAQALSGGGEPGMDEARKLDWLSAPVNMDVQIDKWGETMNWDLQKLYRDFDDPAFLSDVEALRASVEEAVETARTMPMTTGAMESMIARYEGIVVLATKTISFSQLTLAADADCEPAMAAYNRLMPVMNRMEELDSALSARLGELRDLDALIGDSALLKRHAYLLTLLKRAAAHVIDPALEPTVLRMQLTGGAAWERLRDQLDAGLMIDFDQDGEVKKLPLSAIRGLAYSPDADVRRRAYEAELAAYPRMETPMAACLNGIKGEALTLCELKHFDSVLDMSLDSAHMDRATLDALLQAMEESLPMFRRYFRLKARLLGYEGGLRFYDLFAPVGKMKGGYTPEDAHALLVREFGAFSPRMARMIDRAFEERWIDMYPREGKEGGAFCADMYPLGISYVLTNFEGSYSSVSTLAHELGHAYHNECMLDGPILMSDAPMPLAETASIFNETLLAKRMLRSVNAPARMAMLDQQLSDAAQVIVDILSRYLFESEVIARRADTTLSARELCQIMLDAQRRTYGDGLDPDFLHPYMWACKSHYYSKDIHFYNFPYAFGQLFALGVYALYEKKGDAFLPDYEKLLRDAGSGDVRDVAASVGIDVADVNFWRSSLRVFEDSLDELEALANA